MHSAPALLSAATVVFRSVFLLAAATVVFRSASSLGAAGVGCQWASALVVFQRSLAEVVELAGRNAVAVTAGGVVAVAMAAVVMSSSLDSRWAHRLSENSAIGALMSSEASSVAKMVRTTAQLCISPEHGSV